MGKIITFCGIDGCGKNTQSDELQKKLNKRDDNSPNKRDSNSIVVKISFPQYKKGYCSKLIEDYLQGEFREPNPYYISLLHVFDRTTVNCDILYRINTHENSHVITDRYTICNAAYQGAYFETKLERKKFYQWVFKTERKLKIPQTDIFVFLNMRVDTAMRLKKKQREEQGKTPDINEKRKGYLEKVRECYFEILDVLEMTTDVIYIDCEADDMILRGPERISQEIHEKVIAFL